MIPKIHAESVTGQTQLALVDEWARLGFAAAVSEVNSPRIYDYGRLAETHLAITLYDVRRHVLVENNKVRRDGQVKAGRFRIGQPGTDIWVDAVPDVPSGKLLLLYLSNTLLRSVSETYGSGDVELRSAAWDVEDMFLSTIARRLVDSVTAEGLRSTLLEEQLAYTIALHVSHQYSSRDIRSPPPTRDLKMFGMVKDYIVANLDQKITLEQMASVVGLSTAAFIRSFKLVYGKTPHQFVIEQRVEAARNLLANTKMPIADVALITGFASQSHLGIQFRNSVGVAPATFRRDSSK